MILKIPFYLERQAFIVGEAIEMVMVKISDKIERYKEEEDT